MGCRLRIAFPDPDAVLQQPQPQPGVRLRLVLQQHVQPGGCAVGLAPDGEQEVRLAVAQAVVDEGDVLAREAGPPHGAGDRLRQVGAQQGGCFGLVTEHGTEQVIVGLRDLASHTLFHGAWFAGAFKAWSRRGGAGLPAAQVAGVRAARGVT